MQTPLLDSFAMLPLVAGLLVQGIAAFFLIGIKRKSPDKIPSQAIYILALCLVALLGLSTISFIFFPGLIIQATGVLLASIVIMLIVILVYALEAVPEIDFHENPIAHTDEVRHTEEDPLVAIGQDFLTHVSESMTGEINLSRLLDFVNETMIKYTEADGGVIFLADDFDDLITSKSFKGQFPPPYKLPQELPHKPVRVETNFRYIQFNLGETIFGEVAANGKPVLVECGETDKRIFTNGPEDFLRTGSYIVVPLMVKDRVVGVAGIARLPANKPFGEKEFRVSLALAQYAGSSINNIYNVQEILEHADLEREASIASKMQKTLHPKRLPDLPEVGFGSFFNATKGVCGDYYDIILARRDRIAMVIADVAGKGIQSSMVMMMLRSILHLVTNTTKDAGTILDWVNKGITGKIDMDHYATLSFLSYSPEDHSLDYSTAGHQPLLIWRAATKKTELLRQKTDPIGIERSSQYENMKLTVSKGDIIILFTDGLIEALNQDGKQYGIDSLTRVVSETSTSTAKEIANEVKHNIQAFLGSASIHDDQTLVIMKIKA